MDFKTSTSQTRRKILIVEDDEAFRNLLGPVLEKEDCEIHYAENGYVAKKILEKNPNFFDLVLTDVRMPQMSGSELLQAVRSENLRTRFIVMTGFSEIMRAEQAYKLGADGFLMKPFRMQELVDTVERLLNQ